MSGSDIERMIDRLEDVIARTTGASREVALENVPAGDDLPAAGKFESREVTILFADLLGFTAMSEDHPADVVIGLLNNFLERMIEVIYRHGGTVDKFMGDSVMVLFGAHDRHEDDASRAVACAVEMQIIVDAINRQTRQSPLPALHLGIGINTGIVLAGMPGSKQYSEFGVIGRAVNLASRIEAFSLRGQILISESTHHECEGIECSEPIDVYVKGRSGPVPIREVLGIPALGLKVPRQDVRRSHRVKVNIPFVYQLMRNKIILPERLHGTILNIGYYGLLAGIAQPLDRYSEIRLELDLSLVGPISTDIYARTIAARVDGERCLTGLEFTSVGPEADAQIKHFVQLLIQGSETQ